MLNFGGVKTNVLKRAGQPIDPMDGIRAALFLDSSGRSRKSFRIREKSRIYRFTTTYVCYWLGCRMLTNPARLGEWNRARWSHHILTLWLNEEINENNCNER